MAEWTWEKNNELGFDPLKITSRNGIKVWWKCCEGHEWESSVAHRSNGSGCPYCSGRYAIIGKNDLKSVNPDLAEEWNYEKNGELTPIKFTANSGKKVWWKCGKGHEWEAAIAHRNNGSGCPYCANLYVIQGENDLQTVNPSIALEWNYEKNDKLTPADVLPNSNKKVWWRCSNGHEWQAIISNRNSGKRCPYCVGLYAISGETDLQTVNPNLAKEWNYEKNGERTPADMLPNSEKKVWWMCSNGHEWQASIVDRNKGRGCPYCAGKKLIKGYNDLQTVNPALASEWDYEKNGKIKPDDFYANSEEKVWWKCNEGHGWRATINNRNQGRGCPYCSGKKILIGFNDLQTANPKLIKEWNWEKNGAIAPECFTANSHKKVWWKCSKGHEWQAEIKSRNNDIGCPFCSSERHTSFPEYALVYYLEKFGLKTIHLYKAQGYELDVFVPSKNIAIEYDGYYWHQNKTEKDLEKNHKCKQDGITLYRLREGLSPLNDSSIDFIVDKNQKDLSKILSKLLSEIVGTVVDIDLKKDIISIENLREHTEKECSLLVSNPQLAREWNYDKNGNLRTENITANSGKKVWWKCNKNHEWQATIGSRNRGNSCPYCSGKTVLVGFNDLQTLNPILASEWNYDKNSELTPTDVTAGSSKKVWWKCSKGHEWQTPICNRNKGTGCPYCAGHKIMIGYNDLKTINPTLAKDWNYEKNNGLTPADITPNSGQKVWWKCNQKHEWQATVASRNRGNGCPECAKQKRKKKDT